MRIWKSLHPPMVNIERRTLVNRRRRLTACRHFHSDARSTGEIRGYFCGYQNSSNRKVVLGSTACIPIWIPLSRQIPFSIGFRSSRQGRGIWKRDNCWTTVSTRPRRSNWRRRLSKPWRANGTVTGWRIETTACSLRAQGPGGRHLSRDRIAAFVGDPNLGLPQRGAENNTPRTEGIAASFGKSMPPGPGSARALC